MIENFTIQQASNLNTQNISYKHHVIKSTKLVGKVSI